jgi:hypothetical protein
MHASGSYSREEHQINSSLQDEMQARHIPQILTVLNNV